MKSIAILLGLLALTAAIAYHAHSSRYEIVVPHQDAIYRIDRLTGETWERRPAPADPPHHPTNPWVWVGPSPVFTVSEYDTKVAAANKERELELERIRDRMEEALNKPWPPPAPTPKAPSP